MCRRQGRDFFRSGLGSCAFQYNKFEGRTILPDRIRPAAREGLPGHGRRRAPAGPGGRAESRNALAGHAAIFFAE